MLLNSPRYSVLGQVSLLKKVNCTIVLEPETRDPSTDEILRVYEMQTYKIPGLDELYETQHPYFPYDKTFDQARNDPFVVLHTSGSTGLPKPILWTNDWAAAFIQEQRMASPPGFEDGQKCI